MAIPKRVLLNANLVEQAGHEFRIWKLCRLSSSPYICILLKLCGDEWVVIYVNCKNR